MPHKMRRVVVLPVCREDDPSSAFAAELDSILLLSLQRTNTFEVVPLGRAGLMDIAGETQLSSVQVLPDDLPDIIRRKFAADGVLFVDLTVFRPYRPMAIGVRAKLLDLNTMQLVWSADCVFDSSDPAVAKAAMDFAARTTYNPHPVDQSGGILQSPRAFSVFIMDTLFRTLPARTVEAQ